MKYHVAPSLRGGWCVRKYGASRASRRFGDRQSAVRWGRDLSRRRGWDLVVHRADGTVAWKERLNAAVTEVLGRKSSSKAEKVAAGKGLTQRAKR